MHRRPGPGRHRHRDRRDRHHVRAAGRAVGVSTGCLLFIEHHPVPAPDPDESIRRGLLAGVRYVMRTPALLGSMALDLFAVFFGGAVALLPIFAADILHVGPVGLGILRTAPSLGALGVMVVASRWPPGRHAGRTLLLAVAGFSASMLVFGLSTVFVVSVGGARRRRDHRWREHGHPGHDPPGAVAGTHPRVGWPP